jgi:hypothetical protein
VLLPDFEETADDRLFVRAVGAAMANPVKAGSAAPGSPGDGPERDRRGSAPGTPGPGPERDSMATPAPGTPGPGPERARGEIPAATDPDAIGAFVSPRQEEALDTLAAQRTFLEQLVTSVTETTVVADMIRRGDDEAEAARQSAVDENLSQTATVMTQVANFAMGAIGMSAGTIEERRAYNPEEHIDNLIEGIPPRYHNDIMDERTLGAAERSRARILEDLQRQETYAQQYDGAVTNILGTILDIDAPLMLVSGGGLGVARAARVARAASGSQRAGNVVGGFVSGIEAGALVGAGDLLVRETAGIEDLIANTIGGAVLGSAFGAFGGPASTSSLRDLQVDQARQIRENDPALTAGRTDPVRQGTPDMPFAGDEAVLPETPNDGINAQRSPYQPRVTAVDPLDIVTTEQLRVSQHADEFLQADGFYERRDVDNVGFWATIANSKWTSAVGSGFQSRLYTSESPVLNWIGLTVFESSNGFNQGRSTAATLEHTYGNLIQTELLPIARLQQEWSQRNNTTALNSGYGTSDAGKAAFVREIMLERNAREIRARNGTSGPQEHSAYSSDPSILAAADALDRAALRSDAILRGGDGEHSVAGYDNIAANPHYTPQVWSPTRVLDIIRSGRATREAIVEGLANSYKTTGVAQGADALEIASAVIRRAELRAEGVSVHPGDFLGADGRAFVRESLSQDGVSPQRVDGIMKRLGESADQAGQLGFTKSRNSIDMTTPIRTQSGEPLMILDLLSNDLMGDWTRYSRGVSGSAGLARVGITSRTGIKDVIAAAQSEQRALGETVMATSELEAMFTHFEAGAIKGWSSLDPNAAPATQGTLPVIAKRMVNLAWLGKMGLTQLGETSATIIQTGLGNWMRHAVFSNLNKELKSADKALLNELSFLVGAIGQDHKMFDNWVSVDDISAQDMLTFAGKLENGLAKASYVQGYVSFFNAVRSWQQKTAALGFSNRIFQEIRASLDSGVPLSSNRLARFRSDWGIDPVMIRQLEDLIIDGTVAFSPDGFVNRLNYESWDAALAQDFGSSLIRNQNQVIQKSMAGESDPWMSTSWGSILTHLKTFPMQATQKQMVRNFRHNDPQAYAALGMGLATASVVSYLRAAADGDLDTMTLADHANRAFNYSNVTGFIPMVFDPLATAMGLDDIRINRYGAHAEVAPPVLSFVNAAMRLPGASVQAMLGTADSSDRAALRAIPFNSVILIGEMLNAGATRNNPE